MSKNTNQDNLHEMTEKIQDYIDVIATSEAERQAYCLQVAQSMIIASCPYDKERDITMINSPVIDDRMNALTESINEMIYRYMKGAK